MATTIDGVVAALDVRITRAIQQGSPLGYFPALYRKVTLRVKEGIEKGEFADGPRMERLDVLFANRYLDAADALDAGKPATEAWRVAWAAAASSRPIVLQHLMLGMNAHINLDLGIAAATVAPGDALPGLHGDFSRINDILAALVEGVQHDLAHVWPAFGWFDVVLGTTDESIANFSMCAARDSAWALATRLAPVDAAERAALIVAKDAESAAFGKFLLHPGFAAGVALGVVRMTERGSVRQRIRWLQE